MTCGLPWAADGKCGNTVEPFEGVKKLIDFDAANLPPSLGRVHPLITPRGRGSVNKTKKERGFLFGSLV